MTKDTGGHVVSRVRWRRVAVPFESLVANAQATYRTRESVLFEIESGGATGIGEASLPAGASFCKDGQAIAAYLARVLESTLGSGLADSWSAPQAQPFEPATWQAALVCGIETAIADAAARSAGLPLFRWLAREAGLDGEPPAVLEANGLVDFVEPGAAAEAALALAAEGFRTIKMKVGGDPNLAIGAVAAVRAAVGPGLELRCDANQSWDYDSAATFLKGCAPHRVALCEEPLASPGDDFAALARLRTESPVPLAIDESTRTLATLDRALIARAADVLVVKPMSSGLREGLAMVLRAREAALPVIVTTTFDLAPGTAMAMHLAALSGSPPLACGLATLGLVENPLGHGVPPVRDGSLALANVPGLGVSFDHAAIDLFALEPWQEARIK